MTAEEMSGPGEAREGGAGAAGGGPTESGPPPVPQTLAEEREPVVAKLRRLAGEQAPSSEQQGAEAAWMEGQADAYRHAAELVERQPDTSSGHGMVELTRAEWDDIKSIGERWPMVRSELEQLRALRPPAGLPATLASVDDVRKACETAGLRSQPSGIWWADAADDGRVVVEAEPTPLLVSVEYQNDDGDAVWAVTMDRNGPSSVLWHAIQAARSAS